MGKLHDAGVGQGREVPIELEALNNREENGTLFFCRYRTGGGGQRLGDVSYRERPSATKHAFLLRPPPKLILRRAVHQHSRDPKW